MYEKEYANFKIPVLLKKRYGSKKKKSLLSWQLVVVKLTTQIQLNRNPLLNNHLKQEQMADHCKNGPLNLKNEDEEQKMPSILTTGQSRVHQSWFR